MDLFDRVMDHLQHHPLTYMCKLPDSEQLPNLVGHSVLYESPFASDSRIRYADVVNPRQSAYYPDLGNLHPVGTKNSNEVKDSSGLSLTEKLEKMFTVCSAYTEALTLLSDAGLCLGRCLASSLPAEPLSTSNSSSSGSSFATPREMAGCFAKGWHEVADTTRKIVCGFHEGVLAALRDSITADVDLRKNSENEANKLFTACFMSVVQVHYQFSLSMCESIVQLLTNQTNDPTNTAATEAAMTSTSESNPNLSTNYDDGVSKDLASSWCDVVAEMQKQLTAFLHDNRPQIAELASGAGAGRSRFYVSNPTNPGGNEVQPWPNFSRRQQQQQTVAGDDCAGMQPSWYLECPTQDDVAVAFEMHKASKRGSTDSQKSNTFASNEELEDVIGLLSCQPSNPSSPTSETSLPPSSHPLSGNNVPSRDGSNLLWSNTQGIGGNNTGHQSSGYVMDPGGNGKQLLAVDEYGASWGRGNSAEEVGYLREHSAIELQQQVMGLQPLLDIRGNGTSDEQPQHAIAVKSTSWPATNCSRSHSFSTSESLARTQTNNSGNPNFEPGMSTGARAKEPKQSQQQGFFMGLELVGTDLMASVRQRRHSSGESLCKTGRFNSPMSALPASSVRTKSIDNITSDGKCPRTSTWPLKQVSPRSSFNSSFYFRGGGDDQLRSSSSAQQQEPLSNENCITWSSSSNDYPPQGLPPSGAEGRAKKIERKYSLFGNTP